MLYTSPHPEIHWSHTQSHLQIASLCIHLWHVFILDLLFTVYHLLQTESTQNATHALSKVRAKQDFLTEDFIFDTQPILWEFHTGPILFKTFETKYGSDDRGFPSASKWILLLKINEREKITLGVRPLISWVLPQLEKPDEGSWSGSCYKYNNDRPGDDGTLRSV